MVQYQKILFPLDFSVTASTVARHAAVMARQFESELHVLHVIPSYDHHAFPSYGQVMTEIKERAKTALNEFVQQHFAGFEVQTKAVSGHTGRKILEYADKEKISLIVMGTHGRGDLGKLIFGSVAQRVVQSAAIPVMTINPAEASRMD